MSMTWPRICLSDTMAGVGVLKRTGSLISSPIICQSTSFEA